MLNNVLSFFSFTKNTHVEKMANHYYHHFFFLDNHAMHVLLICICSTILLVVVAPGLGLVDNNDICFWLFPNLVKNPNNFVVVARVDYGFFISSTATTDNTMR